MDRKPKEMLWEGLAILVAALTAWLLSKHGTPTKKRDRWSDLP